MLHLIPSHGMHASPLAVSGTADYIAFLSDPWQELLLEGFSEWNSYCQGFD